MIAVGQTSQAHMQANTSANAQSNWIYIADSDADSDSDLEILFDDELTTNPRNATNAGTAQRNGEPSRMNAHNSRTTPGIRNGMELQSPRNVSTSRKITQSEFEEALTNLVVDEMLPFSFIESEAFKKYTNCE